MAVCVCVCVSVCVRVCPKLDNKKGAKKQTGREKKRKILSDRKKPLVLENLNEDKVK